MKHKPQPSAEERLYKVRYPASGFGYLSYAPVGGYRDPSAKSFRRPAAGSTPDEAVEPAAKPEPSAYGKRLHRSISSMKKKLDDLLFNLTTEPTVEAFFLLDAGQYPWKDAVEEEFDGATRRWWGLEGGPDLKAKVLHKLRDRLRYQYPEGWFFYRWVLNLRNGQPTLSLTLLGELGPGKDIAQAGEYLTRTWLELTGSDEPKLVTVRLAHENSLAAFSVKPDPRLVPDLLRLLGGFVFGQILKANMPKVPQVEELLTETELERRKAILIQYHLEHEGLLDADGKPVPQAEAKSSYYRMLRASYGRAFLNRTTGPQFLAGRKIDGEGS